MKKLSLFTATLLTVTALGGQGLTAHAAGNSWQTSTATVNGNRIVVAYNGNFGSSSLMDKLLECIPGLRPFLPETETPDVNQPEAETPDSTPDSGGAETDKPETDIPDTDKPETNIPDTDKPETNIPETDKPETDIPDTDKPEADKPGTNQPGTGRPDTNKPETEKPGTDSDSSQDTDKLSYAQQIVNLVNEERAKEGLSPLTVDKKVRAAAQVRALEIEESFSHTRPDGTKFSTALKEQGVSYKSAGENIAWGQRSPQEVVSAWMNSAGHRANIMNPDFKNIGVGYYQNASGVKYWSQLFTS